MDGRDSGRHDQYRSMLIGGLVVAVIVLLVAALAAGTDEPTQQGEVTEAATRGWVAEMQSVLKNAATAVESYATETNGDYSGINQEELVAQGFSETPGTAIFDIQATSDHYCIIAVHERLAPDHLWKVATYDSAIGAPQADDVC